MLSNRLLRAIELVNRRHARMEARRRSIGQRAVRIGWILFGLASILIAIVALSALPLYFYVTAGLPPVSRLAELMDPLFGDLLLPTRLYDQTGRQLLLSLQPDGIDRKFIEAAEIPWLTEAYVASNQPGYWREDGVDWNDLTAPPQTIAERLVASLLQASEPESWIRNFRTKLLTSEALEKYGKEQVLTWALNSADFGHWAFGPGSAAQLYFGKPASQLSLAESALLAAVAQAPALNPVDNPALATRFQQLILAAMYEQNLISDSEFTEAFSAPLVFAQPRDPVSQYGNFTNLVIEQLNQDLGPRRVINGGLDVTSTLDAATQQQIAELLANGLPGTSALVLDPVNNRVLAAVGDVSLAHEAGNLISPFIYLSAFSTGLSPANLVWDVADPEGARIYDFSKFQGPVNLRMALEDQNPNVDRSLLQKSGIQRDLEKLLEAVGVDLHTTISALQAGRLFEVFSQNGLLPISESPEPQTVLFAAQEDGQVVLDRTRTDWQALVSPETAYLVTDVLAARGSQIAAERAAAVFSDPDYHWWIADSPQRVVVVWSEEIGNDPGLLRALFDAAHRELAIKDWDIPGGLTSILVCVPSGQLPDDDCPQTRREWFLRGNEPTQTDNLHLRLAINNLNGKLATVFTPQEFVQERVFLMVPPEGEVWARAAGIRLSPKDYDPVAPTSGNTTAALLRPAPFSSLLGDVKIIGRLTADVVGYDVQVGQGLYPTEWQQIASGTVAPKDGVLATWHTSGLRGLWAIQVQTWDSDGRITRSYTIVTIKQAEK